VILTSIQYVAQSLTEHFLTGVDFDSQVSIAVITAFNVISAQGAFKLIKLVIVFEKKPNI